MSTELPDVSALSIGILGGTGDQGKGLARRFALAGHTVLIGSRSAERAEAAARDVARLLDRRGLRDIVALAHRVLRESTRLATSGGPRAEDPDATRCTLRQHERSTRRGAASRAVDDDRA